MDSIDEVYARLVGMTEDAATELLKAEGIEFRIRMRDRRPSTLTCAYTPGRLNLILEGGKVTSVSRG